MSTDATHEWKSQEIDKLAAALVAAQAGIKPAVKDCKNDHFKSRYADLASVWAACSEALHANGLAVTQIPVPSERGLTLRTILLHVSGQWLASDIPLMPEMNNPQKVGSAITYARRYGLAAMVGVCPDDDDGEAAAGRGAFQAGRNGHANGNGNGDSRRRVNQEFAAAPAKPADRRPIDAVIRAGLAAKGGGANVFEVENHMVKFAADLCGRDVPKGVDRGHRLHVLTECYEGAEEKARRQIRKELARYLDEKAAVPAAAADPDCDPDVDYPAEPGGNG